MVKGFLRWYVSSATGRLDEDKRPTVRTAKAWAERFFGGFKESTKTEIHEDDRKEVYGVSSLLPYRQNNAKSSMARTHVTFEDSPNLGPKRYKWV